MLRCALQAVICDQLASHVLQWRRRPAALVTALRKIAAGTARGWACGRAGAEVLLDLWASGSVPAALPVLQGVSGSSVLSPLFAPESLASVSAVQPEPGES